MKRTERAALAKETVEIVARGSYASAGGQMVDISAAMRECLGGTRYFTPDELERLRQTVDRQPANQTGVTIELMNETTLAGIERMVREGRAPVAALNFASAKNPGGGFLSGSQAQEESLARSSGLHASLMQGWEFYETHRATQSLLYTDAMILSPRCPVFRNDDGALLDAPHVVTFITSPAPNAGAAADNRPDEVPLIPEVFRRRAEYVLTLAASQGYKCLVLGAWGCGVFRNDPGVVAEAFMTHLCDSHWRYRFERVLFSVLDPTPPHSTYSAFLRSMR